MTVSLVHAFESTVVDENNPGEVGPDEWNAEHTLTQATGKLLGRTTAGTGATEEITPNSTLTLSGGALGVVNADLTKVDDTNVTLTLGGTPTGAVLKATSITLGWAGTLSPARGGTGVANNSASTITISGNFGTTFTVTGVTVLTLPTSGTLATTADLSAGYQPLDSDLTAIAAISPSNDDVVQRKAGAWTNRTMAQVTADLVAASEGAQGAIELATTTEAQTGIDTSRAITAAGLRASTREKLTANRTYYIRTDGSDSNTGLADTSGAAFLTIQKAWNVIVTLDLAGYTATIQIADGTYTGGLGATVGPVGGNVTINGNSGTPANVIVSTAGNSISATTRATITLTNFEVRSSAASGVVAGAAGAKIICSTGMRYGACAAAQTKAEYGGDLQIATAYTIAGAAIYHHQADTSGIITSGGGITVTNSGTNAFTVFARASATATIVTASNTYTGGTITGTRYIASSNAVINTFGGGASYFPGDAAGSTSTGGQYL